jgi:hypothetical protein
MEAGVVGERISHKDTRHEEKSLKPRMNTDNKQFQI